MDKRIQSAKEFVMDKKNRTTVIAAAAGIVGVITGIAGIVFGTKRGKKRK